MNTRINNICVIGLGYVGLTLAVTLAKNGFKVFGIEKNKEILRQLKQGKPHFHERGLAELLNKHKGRGLLLLEKIPQNEEIDCFIIAVCTPIDKVTKKPKISYIIRAVKEINSHLKPKQLIILRSTVPVGATRNIVLPILQKKYKDFYLSFCPERTVEGKALIELGTLPQVIGALNEESMFKSVELFSKITSTIIKVSSLEAAEIIKLVDNGYRDSIFAFANQVALICRRFKLDANEVIQAANFGYSRNNIPRPGFVGGACLEKDPYILIDSAKGVCDLIKTARKINENLPFLVLGRVKNYLKEKRKKPREIKLFISGFAFKGEPETDDLRGSPTVKLLDLLKGAKIKNIFGHDFIVKKDNIKKLGVKPCSIEDGFTNADVVIFMNNHRSYFNLNIEKLVKKIKKDGFIFDGWQIFSNQLKEKNHHIIYESLGFKK